MARQGENGNGLFGGLALPIQSFRDGTLNPSIIGSLYSAASYTDQKQPTGGNTDRLAVDIELYLTGKSEDASIKYMVPFVDSAFEGNATQINTRTSNPMRDGMITYATDNFKLKFGRVQTSTKSIQEDLFKGGNAAGRSNSHELVTDLDMLNVAYGAVGATDQYQLRAGGLFAPTVSMSNPNGNIGAYTAPGANAISFGFETTVAQFNLMGHVEKDSAAAAAGVYNDAYSVGLTREFGNGLTVFAAGEGTNFDALTQGKGQSYVVGSTFKAGDFAAGVSISEGSWFKAAQNAEIEDDKAQLVALSYKLNERVSVRAQLHKGNVVSADTPVTIQSDVTAKSLQVSYDLGSNIHANLGYIDTDVNTTNNIVSLGSGQTIVLTVGMDDFKLLAT